MVDPRAGRWEWVSHAQERRTNIIIGLVILGVALASTLIVSWWGGGERVVKETTYLPTDFTCEVIEWNADGQPTEIKCGKQP